MATHSSILTWEIPWTEEPGRSRQGVTSSISDTVKNILKREVGGGIRMGNTCKSMADSCQCMTKTITIL